MEPLSALLLIPMSLAAAATFGARPGVERTTQAPPRSLTDARSTATRALGDQDPRARLAGARFLRRGDVLAELIASAWIEDDVRIAALGALGARDGAAAVDGVVAGLAAVPIEVRVAAAQLAERIHDIATLPALAATLQDLTPRWPDASAEVAALTVALTRAFARLHGPPVEYALLRLTEAPTHEARAIATAALARVGTRRALERLEALTRDRDAALREAARHALCAIRFRHGTARGGAVSLTHGPREGALSLV